MIEVKRAKGMWLTHDLSKAIDQQLCPMSTDPRERVLMLVLLIFNIFSISIP